MKVASPANARSAMGPIIGQASLQMSLNGRPSASGLAPRIGVKASLYSVISSLPQTRQQGNRDDSTMPAATRKALGQAVIGPSGVAAQSKVETRKPISPQPARNEGMEESICMVVATVAQGD